MAVAATEVPAEKEHVVFIVRGMAPHGSSLAGCANNGTPSNSSVAKVKYLPIPLQKMRGIAVILIPVNWFAFVRTPQGVP